MKTLYPNSENVTSKTLKRYIRLKIMVNLSATKLKKWTKKWTIQSELKNYPL